MTDDAAQTVRAPTLTQPVGDAALDQIFREARTADVADRSV